MATLHEIERAIEALPSHELEQLRLWFDQHRTQVPDIGSGRSVFEQGLGLFGSPSDADLLDEVVRIAYDERRRPTRRTPSF